MSLTSKNLFKSVVPRSKKAHSCSQQDTAALTRFSLAAPIPFSFSFFFFLFFIFLVIIFQTAAAFVVLRC